MTNFRSFQFDVPPLTGDAVMYRGQRYELVGSKPHTRQDGDETILLTWRSHCATCGEPIEITTPLTTRWPTRRCRDCAAPGRRVGK